ncbi:MAG: hypothetical protein IJ629_03620 [Clostridia bacterium]|nr:hypothetical protein [Clostridia bacterium]
MEERSLKVIEPNTTFFNKISNTISKLLTPGKIGLNGMLISIKRNNVIKYYENYKKLEKSSDVSKKDQALNRYDESYTLYLESVDKFIMDSVYKKVKNGSATVFERDALANYYNIVHLKETEYLEYKYRKQKFLLELDFENFKSTGKDKLVEKYKNLYVEKMDVLYKGIIKNYSIKLADGIRAQTNALVHLYKSIFETLEEYIKKVVPIKLEIDKTNENYNTILAGYEEYEKFAVGKLDEKEYLEKNMILLGLSRVLFTHSLPLIAAEQCYNKLLRDLRALIVTITNEKKKEEAYKMLIKLIEDYNVKLLSTKVYWENSDEREKYKKFWGKYSKATNSEEKEILAIQRELSQVDESTAKNKELRKFYKAKLVDLGAMKTFKNSFVTGEKARYIRVAVRN